MNDRFPTNINPAPAAEAIWVNMPETDPIRRIFCPDSQSLPIVIEQAGAGAIRIWTTLAHWGDVALVLEGPVKINYELPLSGHLEQSVWPAQGKADEIDDPGQVRLYLRLGNGFPLVLDMTPGNWLAQTRFFTYSHAYRQDSAYLTADSEELAEKALVCGISALNDIERDILAIARIVVLIDHGWFDDPERSRKVYNQLLMARQKDLSSHEPDSIDPVEALDQFCFSFSASAIIRAWIIQLDARQIFAWLDQAQTWIAAHGGDQELITALKDAAGACELPGDRWRALHASLAGDLAKCAESTFHGISGVGESRQSKSARHKGSRDWQALFRQPPGSGNLPHALAAAYAELGSLWPERPAAPWRPDLLGRLDKAMSERGYAGAYPEYHRRIGRYDKGLTIHEQLLDDEDGQQLLLSAQLFYWNEPVRAWVSTGHDLLLLEAVVHPLALLDLDGCGLFAKLDTLCRILEGSELTGEDRQRLSRDRESQRGMVSGLTALSILTGILIFAVGLFLNAATDLFVKIAGDAAHPWSLYRICTIAAVSLLLAVLLWLPIMLISRHGELPLRRLGRR